MFEQGWMTDLLSELVFLVGKFVCGDIIGGELVDKIKLNPLRTHLEACKREGYFPY